MSTAKRLFSRIFGMFSHHRTGGELNQELQSHFEMLVDENIRSGLSPLEAHRKARLVLGGEAQIAESFRDQAGLPRLETIAQDVRYGTRLLRKNPGFTLVTVLTLALGIGANTAIFSVVNAVLLRPLPYPGARELISLKGNQSRPDVSDIKDQSRTIESIGAFGSWQFDLAGTGEPEQVQGALVSLDLFKTLKVPPELGRTFNAEEDNVGGERVVVLSHGFWQRKFGGDRSVLGRTLSLSGNSYVIIGVMPPSFWLPRGESELWTPNRVAYPEAAAARGLHAQYAIARLRRGVSHDQAQADLDGIAAGLAKLYPDENRDRRFIVMGLKERVIGNVRTLLFVLQGAVALVLLISSLNFANLLLAKAVARHNETQVRAALGASAGRLFQQYLTESLLISLLGGVVGLAFGKLGLRLLLLLKPEDLPRLDSVQIDPSVLFFTAIVSVTIGCLFGLLPALQVVIPAQRSSQRMAMTAASQTRSTARFRQFLIVSEIAIALVLLCGAGLLMRSISRLQSVDIGFNSQDVLTARIWLQAKKYESIPAQNTFYSDLESRLKQIPGVQSASLISELPMGGMIIPHDVVINGRPPLPVGTEPGVLTNLVTPAYFSTLEVPLLKGRFFTAADRVNSPPVAIVNAAMVREHFENEDPIGKQVDFARRSGPRKWFTIVGVVGDIREFGLDTEDSAAMYIPMAQKDEPWRRWSGIVVRSNTDPQALTAAIKQAVWSVDANVPVTKVRFLNELLAESIAQRKFNTLLLGIFAATALILALVGVYGVMSYAVTQRTREIGVRMALGAQRCDVLWLFLKQGIKITVLGVAIGVCASIFAARGLKSLVFGITTHDPGTFISVTILLALIAIAACMIPATRALKINPNRALRFE